MSGQWTAQDEAQLEEMMQRRKASFEALSGAVWSGIAPSITDTELADKLTNAVVDVLLREGRQVAPLFRTFDTPRDNPGEGWTRVIMPTELWERTVAIQKKTPGEPVWNDALKAALIRAGSLLDYFNDGALDCVVEATGRISPRYKGEERRDLKPRIQLSEDIHVLIEQIATRQGQTMEEAVKGAVTVAAQLSDAFQNKATYCTVKPGGIVTPAYVAQPTPEPEELDALGVPFTFNPTADEGKALSRWVVKKGLSASGIMRQAFRMYDAVERALEDPAVAAVKVAYNGFTAIPKELK